MSLGDPSFRTPKLLMYKPYKRGLSWLAWKGFKFRTRRYGLVLHEFHEGPGPGDYDHEVRTSRPARRRVRRSLLKSSMCQAKVLGETPHASSHCSRRGPKGDGLPCLPKDAQSEDFLADRSLLMLTSGLGTRL